MTVPVLKQVESDTPEALRTALSDELFERLRMRHIPVLLLRPTDKRSWAGFALGAEYTERGEVVLDAKYTEARTVEPSERLLVSLYLHEAAHRLSGTGSHDAPFMAIMLVLYIRAGEIDGRPLWHDANLYDIQDGWPTVPRAITWAVRIAEELAPSDKSAEEVAQLVNQRYQTWVDWVAGEADRRTAAKAASEAAKAEKTALSERVRQLKLDRWLWGSVGAVVGMLAFGLVALTH